MWNITRYFMHELEGHALYFSYIKPFSGKVLMSLQLWRQLESHDTIYNGILLMFERINMSILLAIKAKLDSTALVPNC